MRPAASLILLRDAPGGPEVLLVQRNSTGDFPGLHVFPGGLVDEADRDPAVLARSRRDEASAQGLLGIGDALPWFIAALRESLEEVALLPGLAADAEQLAEWQRGLNARQHRLADIPAGSLPELATDRLGFFSHWITPEGIPRRYDTRFFVARVDPGQTVNVDGREAVAADWLSPADALAAHESGSIRLIFPTIRNLQALAAYPTVEAVLQEAHRPRPVPVMLPKMQFTGGAPRMLLPGDAGYEEA